MPRPPREAEPVALLAQILDTLSGLPSALRQLNADELWGKIPTDVEELGYNPAVSVAPTVITPLQAVSGLWLCTSMVAVMPAGASGFVLLGALRIPVGPGVTSVIGKRFLSGSDVRSLTVTTAPAGPDYAALWLCGEQRPTFGAV